MCIRDRAFCSLYIRMPLAAGSPINRLLINYGEFFYLYIVASLFRHSRNSIGVGTAISLSEYSANEFCPYFFKWILGNFEISSNFFQQSHTQLPQIWPIQHFIGLSVLHERFYMDWHSDQYDGTTRLRAMAFKIWLSFNVHLKIVRSALKEVWVKGIIATTCNKLSFLLYLMISNSPESDKDVWKLLQSNLELISSF